MEKEYVVVVVARGDGTGNQAGDRVSSHRFRTLEAAQQAADHIRARTVSDVDIIDD